MYSIAALASIPLRAEGEAFALDCAAALPSGVSAEGMTRDFSTVAPVSLYGSTKLASEGIALEYGDAFDFPVWVIRCGVLAGAGQFGTPDQGIFSYWINAHLRRRPLRYIGFDGTGKQVRDALHPSDLASLIDAQFRYARRGGQRVYTAGGGARNACSLAMLNDWCDAHFGANQPVGDARPRPYDVPWMIMDSREAGRDFAWRIETPLEQIFEQIAEHASANPKWLEISGL